MGNRDAQNQGSACHGEHLVAVAEDKKQVGVEVAQSACHAVHTLAHSHHGVNGRVVIDRHRHHAVDVQPVALDFVPSAAILFAQVHIGGNNLKSHVGTLAERLSHFAKKSPVGAGAGNDANFSMIHLIKHIATMQN